MDKQTSDTSEGSLAADRTIKTSTELHKESSEEPATYIARSQYHVSRNSMDQENSQPKESYLGTSIPQPRRLTSVDSENLGHFLQRLLPREKTPVDITSNFSVGILNSDEHSKKEQDVQVITLKTFQSGGSVYVIPKSQPPAARPAASSMHQAGYSAAHVRPGSAPTSNMASNLVPNMASTMAPSLAPSMAPVVAPSYQARMNFAFKVPEHAQSQAHPPPPPPPPHLYSAAAASHLKPSHAPVHTGGVGARLVSQASQVAAPSLHMPSPHLGSPTMVSPHLTSPRVTSSLPHMTSPTPHMMTSPRMASPSPHMTSHSPRLASPHMTSHSPRLTSPHMTSPHLPSHSPRLTSLSPHLPPPQSPQHLNHTRAIRLDTQEYGRPPEKDPSSFVPLDLTTPKAMSSIPASRANADSPLDLSVKPNRKRDHEDDDVIVIGEHLIPFKSRRLPETYAYTYPGSSVSLGGQAGAHRLSPGHPSPGGVSVGAHYVKSSTSAVPHSSPYYYPPGGGHHKHPVYHHQPVGGSTASRMMGQHTSGSVGAAVRGSYAYPGQTAAPQSSPHHVTYRGTAGVSRPETTQSSSASASHVNSVHHTYPYTVSPGGSRGVVQLPHSASLVTGKPGSVRYVYQTNGNANIRSTTPPAQTQTQQHTVGGGSGTTPIRVSSGHRSTSQERLLQYNPQSSHTLTVQRAPPAEKLSATGSQPSHITISAAPGPGHQVAVHYVRASSGVIQHVGPAHPTLYDARGPVHKPPAYPTPGGDSSVSPASSQAPTQGAGAQPPSSLSDSSSNSDLTVTGHYYQPHQGAPRSMSHQPAASHPGLYPAGAQLSIPRPTGPRLPAAISTAGSRPVYMYEQYRKLLVPEAGAPQHSGHQQPPPQSLKEQDVEVTGSTGGGGGQVGRIQPYHQLAELVGGQRVPPQQHGPGGSYLQQPHAHHLAPPPPPPEGVAVTTGGYVQYPGSQNLHVSGYVSHGNLAATNPAATAVVSSASSQGSLLKLTASSSVPAHIFPPAVRPVQSWPAPGSDAVTAATGDAPVMPLPKRPVANVNPIVQRRSPSLLHHKKQMVHQSRLECRTTGSHQENMVGAENTGRPQPHGGALARGIIKVDADATTNNTQTPGMVPSMETCQAGTPSSGEAQGGVSKADMLDFSKLTRGLDTYRSCESLIKLEQQEQLMMKQPPLAEQLPPPTELKIPMVPLKERIKSKDHFGRASPLCGDDVSKKAKLHHVVDGAVSTATPGKVRDNKVGKAKEAQNAKIHKYYPVKAKPASAAAGRVKKAQTAVRAVDKSGKKSSSAEQVVSSSPSDQKDLSNGVRFESAAAAAAPKKRVYRRKNLHDGFTKKDERGRGRTPRLRDDEDSGPKGAKGKKDGVDLKRKRKPRISKPLADAKRRKQKAANHVVLSTRTRTQTAATKGVRRPSNCYNKNAAYERELKREEYRKIIKRFKRQNRQRCGRESVRVTRERLGVIFQSDSGSEEEDEDEEEEEDEHEENEHQDTRRVTSHRARGAKKRPTGSGHNHHRKRADPRDPTHDDGDHHHQEEEYDDDDEDYSAGEEEQEEVEESVGSVGRLAAVKSGRCRGKGGGQQRGSTRGGFTRDTVEEEEEEEEDGDYRPARGTPNFLYDDEEDEEEEEEEGDEYVDDDGPQRPEPPLRAKSTSGGRHGRGRGGRVFRRRGGAWYDKRRDKKKRKPAVAKEKVETESIESRGADDCANQEALSAPEMARRLVICKETGETLLHKAARLGLDEVVLYCLQSGFDVNSRDNAGYTPLHETCVRGHVAAARMLISHGADINANAHDGTRPMHDAVDNNNAQIVRLLLACGVDTKLVSFGGRDVMKLAKSDAMRQLLRGYFGDLNGANPERGFEEIPWAFASSGVLEDGFTTGCDIMAGVPPEAEDAEGFIEFDFCDTPHLPTYYLQIVPTKGALNYHLLDDVLMRLGCSKDFFTTSHPHLAIIEHDRKSLPGLPAKTEPLPSTSSAASPGGDVVHLLELTDELRSVLGVETEREPFLDSPLKAHGDTPDSVESCEGSKSMGDSHSQHDGTDPLLTKSPTPDAGCSNRDSVLDGNIVTAVRLDKVKTCDIPCPKLTVQPPEAGDGGSSNIDVRTRETVTQSKESAKIQKPSPLGAERFSSLKSGDSPSNTPAASLSAGCSSPNVMSNACDVNNSDVLTNPSGRRLPGSPLMAVVPVNSLPQTKPATVSTSMVQSVSPMPSTPGVLSKTIGVAVPIAPSPSVCLPKSGQPAVAVVEPTSVTASVKPISHVLPLTQRMPPPPVSVVLSTTVTPTMPVMPSVTSKPSKQVLVKNHQSATAVAAGKRSTSESASSSKSEGSSSVADLNTGVTTGPPAHSPTAKIPVAVPSSYAQDDSTVDGKVLKDVGCSRITQNDSISPPEKSAEEHVRTSLERSVFKPDRTKLSSVGGRNDISVTTLLPTISSSKEDNSVVAGSIFKPCVINVVNSTSSSAPSDYMKPLYTGVAFISNIPMGEPRTTVGEIHRRNSDHTQEVSRKQDREGLLTPSSGSQVEVAAQVSKIKSRSCSESELDHKSGYSRRVEQEHITEAKQGNSSCAGKADCSMGSSDNSKKEDIVLNSNTNNNSGCDVNNTSSGVTTLSEPHCTEKEAVTTTREYSQVNKKQQQSAPLTAPVSNSLPTQSQVSVTSDMSEIKIADAPGSCLKQLAHKRQSGEERSISPKAAETMPQEADDIPSACDGAATTSGEEKAKESTAALPSGEIRKESNNNITEEASDTALPVLEKHERGEAEEAPKDKGVTEPATDDASDDREMPQLTIQAY